ncbi:uncharacterized protein LOC124896759 [Capsicum annuum]|uniref:uncharacterized protein LOC124896759 n=1 Tax=Capsicum annuum TaxID=4072 RepID=UPI001FB187D4|nr:uncharacterized protein LOC124896759 [Capsicum annuum]
MAGVQLAAVALGVEVPSMSVVVQSMASQPVVTQPTMRFVENFAIISSPMTGLTQKEVSFRWSEKYELISGKLKDCLTSAPVLPLPIESGGFTMFCDALGIDLGCVLMQERHVITYASR